MATLNHAKIITALENLITEADKSEFIFDFLSAYGTAKSTITRLKSGDKQRNVAQESGDIALPKSIYFRVVEQGESVLDTLEELISLPLLGQHKIRFVLVTDFKNIACYDRKVKDKTFFEFSELHHNYDFFLPLTGKYEKAIAYTEHPADVKACEKMGKLYDSICEVNKYGKEDLHTLNVFLARLLFCFFAEDTGIFPQPHQMTKALQALTQEDGSDLEDFFEKLFLALGSPNEDEEKKTLPKVFQEFPYVNGGLFEEIISIPCFNARSRRLLLECGKIEWQEISPVIFGAMFQAVMDQEKRREMGAHYTSEKNILKVIRPLFLDALQEEFEEIKNKTISKKAKISALDAFHKKIASLGFLDPACGCGNFLIVAYRELKELELLVIMASRQLDNLNLSLNVDFISKVRINQFYGIELEEFPVEIARVSMWLMEHVINRKFGKALGLTIASVPLKNSATVVCTNALTAPWEDIVVPEKLNYIFGNPPFSGYSNMTIQQKQDLSLVFKNRHKTKSIDYVTAWFEKASLYMLKNQYIQCAFVATNSICQGEQVAILWKTLRLRGITINFAHQTFKWNNEAKCGAAVYCIIVCFSYFSQKEKRLFTYKNINQPPEITVCETINSYLYNTKDIIIDLQSKELSAPLPMIYGNKLTDGGNLIIEGSELQTFQESAPQLIPYIHKLYGAIEFLQSIPRYCLWLKNAPLEILELPEVKNRIDKVKAMRLASKASSTRDYAKHSHLFRQITQPENVPYLLIPRVSSEKRKYIPIGFMDKESIASDAVQIIPNANIYHFGILTSNIHMIWMRTVCGRLKSDYRYSRDLCYNTFPWPKTTSKQQEYIEELAQNVLDVRDMYPDMTLAKLYNPESMPKDLEEAHNALDLAVDKLYQNKAFADDDERLQLLFKLYAELVDGTNKK